MKCGQSMGGIQNLEHVADVLHELSPGSDEARHGDTHPSLPVPLYDRARPTNLPHLGTSNCPLLLLLSLTKTVAEWPRLPPYI